MHAYATNNSYYFIMKNDENKNVIIDHLRVWWLYYKSKVFSLQ